MAHKFVSGRQLKNLLNDVERVHKKDIHDYAGGHLNETYIHQVAMATNRVPWQSAKEVPTPPSGKNTPKPRSSKKGKSMKEILYQFSVGTTGSIPHSPPAVQVPRQTPASKKSERSSRGSPNKRYSSASNSSAKSTYTNLEDGVLIEELETTEMMMPSGVRGGRDVSFADEETMTYTTATSLAPDNTGKLKFKYTFLPMQNVGITKQDQYRKFKNFESTVLRKQETCEQKVLSGVKAVEHHERKLQQELDAFNLNGMGPNFHKLQVYSDTFEDLIQESPTFAYILRCIKSEYDNYIASLLDGQTAQHHVLQDQVDQMAARGTSRPRELFTATERLASLEEYAKTLLQKNEQMREEVREQTEWLATAPEPEPVPTIGLAPVHYKDTQMELADEIEHVKALILEKLDALNALRCHLRDECVPLTVCTHLEQCIKETEVEVQKLLKQNEYYERSIAEMDHDLKEAIIDADTSEKDAKRIWRKVNSKRGIPGARPSPSQPQSDSDDEEESKWNWYIS
ncbi:uncharacterized protein C6orf118-like [Haliotis rufescens]|uniref:uncharacterized protein C6orf118-like n=1 Tax=Haliotis rufescens TaxID=6454 RepID=UPI00201F080F|nr:uncharacterized protein C6orf118-like [Haliotis rufescens]